MPNNFYLNFENTFRGDSSSIKNILSRYDNLVDIIIDSKFKHTFVDIGCGRGEWLEKWHEKIDQVYGLEFDDSMIDLCKEKGLNVIKGDATKTLSKFKSDSISLITIFHMIEHIKFEEMSDLYSECFRVLSEDGVLLIETPSIDNLLISTNHFYVDHTHTSHINSDSVSFLLTQKGFNQVESYYIHGGPLQNAEHSKLTRVLNGVAQDLLFVSVKGKDQSKKIFSQKDCWLPELDAGITTLQAAIDFDISNKLVHDRLSDFNQYSQDKIVEMNKKISQLESDLLLSKEQINQLMHVNNHLQHLIKVMRILKNLFRPAFKFVRLIKNISIRFIYLLINNILKFKVIRNFILSYRVLKYIKIIFLKLDINSPSINARLEKQMKKLEILNLDSNNFNNKLLRKFNRSSKARMIFDDIFKCQKENL